MENKDFKIDDLVAVVGGSISKDDEIEKTAMIGKVVAVGLQDMFVESINAYPYSTHKVSKSLCQKILACNESLQASVNNLKPCVGDLVVSYKKAGHDAGGKKCVAGVLYKVTYILGKEDMCTILEGTEFHHVKFSSLLVLQKESSSSF